MKLFAILIAASAFATGAIAQDAATDAAIADDGVVVDQPAGFTVLRPIDCGTFHYWNGERCADARYDPPVAR
jgi:hypothetical protein